MRSCLSRSLNKKKKGENSIILVESIFLERTFFCRVPSAPASRKMTTFLQNFVLQFSFSCAAMYFEEQASVKYGFYKPKAGLTNDPDSPLALLNTVVMVSLGASQDSLQCHSNPKQ